MRKAPKLIQYGAPAVVFLCLEIGGRLFAQSPADMVLVKGGTFRMGDSYDDTQPVHSVTLNDFYLGATEVTRREFADFIRESGYRTTAERENDVNTWHACYGRQQDGDRHPAVCLSWWDSVAYCNWRSKKEGLVPVYAIHDEGPSTSWRISVNWSANGYRLPTEAEWEYAARGAGKNERWSGTDDRSALDLYAWYLENSGAKTHPVGSRRANDLGLFDMSGSVWEWAWDWYGDYRPGKQINPHGPESGTYRVVRGGSWDDIARSIRTTCRFSYWPHGRMNGLTGFRLSRNAR